MPLPVTTIETDIHLIKFKFARILRTDMGRWTEAEQALQIGMLNDNWYREAQGCQRDIDCQRVSAAMALTVCPIQARSALARATPRSGLGLKNFWKPGPYQMDSTVVVIKPLSARLRTSRRHRL